jgi:hypothetical protein
MFGCNSLKNDLHHQDLSIAVSNVFSEKSIMERKHGCMQVIDSRLKIDLKIGME